MTAKTKIKKAALRWTSTKRGAIEHAYQGQRCVGWIARQRGGPLGTQFDVHQVPATGPVKRLCSIGGGFEADARIRAMDFLAQIVAAEAK